MNFAYIHKEDMEHLEKNYTSAYNYLLSRTLWNEYWYYKSQKSLNSWEQARLEELHKHFNFKFELEKKPC